MITTVSIVEDARIPNIKRNYSINIKVESPDYHHIFSIEYPYFNTYLEWNDFFRGDVIGIYINSHERCYSMIEQTAGRIIFTSSLNGIAAESKQVFSCPTEYILPELKTMIIHLHDIGRLD